MRIQKHLQLIHDLTFRNTSEKNMSLETVYDRMIRFMKQDLCGAYELRIGTDCQVHTDHTKFITGVMLIRKGKGTWAAYRQVIVPMKIHSIKEKLTRETSYSGEIALFFDQERRNEMEDLILPHIYRGASFDAYIDIDAGTDELKNKTAPYVAEMVRWVESMGMKAKIKPESISASCYANRHTKKPFRASAAQ